MIAIDSLVPDFTKALEKLPGRSQAWGTLSDSLASSTLPARSAALVHVAIAQRSGCGYAQWVIGRLAERQWVSAEDIFLATAATARDADEAAIVKAAWNLASDARESGNTIYRALANRIGIERATEVLSQAALAMMACEALATLAPACASSTTAAERRRS
jgi:hypothetical protein